MKCRICSVDEVIRTEQHKVVKFYCRNGHSWSEKYIDEGGFHQRPEAYNKDFKNILFPKEKIIYEKLLSEIGKNITFFKTASPEEVTNYLVDNCNLDKKNLLLLFKKVDEFNKGI